VLRENFKTDNGNLIIDCHGLILLDRPKSRPSSTISPAW